MGLLSYFFAEKPETPVKKEICYFIEGFLACPYFQEAMSLADRLDTTSSQSKIQVEEIPGAQDHRTSPVVWEGCAGQPMRFIGGYDNFMQYARKKHFVGESRNV
ncbi:hypothetical protein BGZ74_005436 [Mortierella antarctica]|nr:hypothetical protein BGZ74_005436 [Mortierella antarctica]KAG0359825.1 hypothetical protein BG005_000096 [Podila minutissima]